MSVALPRSLWYLPVQLVWWTGHDQWLWLCLDHYDTFPSSWCDGQAMIYDCGFSWIVMIPSRPAGVMDRPWSMIAALPGSLWYLLFRFLWWTGHDLWLWEQAMINDCGPSLIIMIPSHPAGMMDRPWSIIVALPKSLWYLPVHWCDGQAMIYDCGCSWNIMIPPLPAGMMDRQWYLPFQLMWRTGHDTFPSSWCEGQAMINDCGSSWIFIHSIPAGVMDRPWYLPFQLMWWTGNYDTFPSSRSDGQATIHSIPAGVMDSPWSMIVALPGLLWYLPLQLVWWTDHDLWLWLFLDYYGTFPSSWCDGQTTIYDCGSSWIIMIVSLPAGLMDRPWSIIVILPGSLWYLPLQLLWWADHDLWLWLFLGQYDSLCDRRAMIYDYGSF